MTCDIIFFYFGSPVNKIKFKIIKKVLNLLANLLKCCCHTDEKINEIQEIFRSDRWFREVLRAVLNRPRFRNGFYKTIENNFANARNSFITESTEKQGRWC